jgi:hypothetical protein
MPGNQIQSRPVGDRFDRIRLIYPSQFLKNLNAQKKAVLALFWEKLPNMSLSLKLSDRAKLHISGHLGPFYFSLLLITKGFIAT